MNLVLGIESSCDETAAAVVEGGRRIRSNVIASQIATHSVYGGVVPELASREHLEKIGPVIDQALEEAGVTMDDVDGIAVTNGPGLIGSLLVGVSYAKSLAYARRKPIVGVNHIEGHIYSVAFDNPEVEYPAVALVVSGGHTNLFLIEEPERYRLLGRTRDDAAGEAYDKVAKLLGLGYPGGPIIDTLAKQGNDTAIRWPGTRLTHADRNAPELKGDLDFSFSGLKTAVLRHVTLRREQGTPLSDQEIADICASFQRAVVRTLVERAFTAQRRFGAKSVGVAGGVSANSRLRADIKSYGDAREIPTFVPSLKLSTDNAAMIAAAGLRKLRAGVTSTLDMNADAALTLA